MNRKNGVRTGRSLIQQVVSSGPVGFTLEETVQSLLLILALDHGQALEVNLTFSVVQNAHTGAGLLMWGHVGQHVEQELVVDFNVGDFDNDLSIETAAHLGKDVVDGAGDHTTVLVILGTSSHREGLAGASLTIAHDSAVVAVDNR